MDAVTVIVVAMASYLLGTFPTAVLVGRRRGFDPTTSGSGNPGASNTTRIGGLRAGALVLAGDAGKGAVAAGLGYLADGRSLAWAAGALAVAGHLWPVTRGLKGGKGVATAAGVGLVCAPVAVAALGMVFAVVVKVSGKAAVGSLVAVAGIVPAQALLGQTGVEIGIGAAIALVITVRHRENIVRLWTGTESGVR